MQEVTGSSPVSPTNTPLPRGSLETASGASFVLRSALNFLVRAWNRLDPTGALLAGEVCQNCNGGWINELEARFRAVMFPPPHVIDEAAEAVVGVGLGGAVDGGTELVSTSQPSDYSAVQCG